MVSTLRSSFPRARCRGQGEDGSPEYGRATRDTEPDILNRVRRVAAPTHGRSAAPVLVEPTPSAQHPIGVVGARVVVLPAPPPPVPQRVVQAPAVGLFLADRVRLLVGIAAIPGDRVEVA